MKLYQFQEDVLKQTKEKNRVAYYLDMGLGKTFVGSEKMMNLGKNFNLIVCQKSKIDDWIDHIEQNYSEHPYCIEVFDLTKKKQLERFLQIADTWEPYMEMYDEQTGQTYLEDNPDPCQYIGIINYELAWRRKDLLKLENFTLMLDESSLIQNSSAKQTDFILKMHPQNVILLSGTPVGGKYENLWTQGHLLGWNISEDLYQRQYINWTLTEDDGSGIRHKIVNKDEPYKNIDRLKMKFRENGAVFLKTDEVFDLPEQNFIKIRVDSSKEYHRFMKKNVLYLTDKEGNEVELLGDTILTKMLNARMLCGIYSKDKQDAFTDLLESTQDRLIVFYNFNEELKILERICQEHERPVSVICGYRKNLESYEEKDNSVTLIQYQAGSMGLNLQKANKIVYFTLPLSSEKYEQSKKRIHRIGQGKPCFYYQMICKGSIEEDILYTLQERKDYTDELFKEKNH